MFAISIENLKRNIITSSLSIVYSKWCREYDNIFKEEQSIKILKILGLIDNIEKHNNIFNHV